MRYRVPLSLLLALALSGCGGEPGSPVVGTLERDRIVLTAEQAEPIAAIEVREGQRVEAGAALVRLDTRRARSERERLAAERDRAQRRLDEMVRGPREEIIDQARAGLNAAQSTVAQAERELARVQRLRQQDLSSQQALDSARARLETAEGERDAARANLQALLAGTTVEELDQARAAVRAAEAALQRQELTIERLSVQSPRPARVEALPFEPGETPTAGAPVAVLRATDEPPYARVYVPAALRARLQPGSAVQVSVDGHGSYAGEVSFLASEAAYTPYYALTEQESGRLSYLAEIVLPQGGDLPTGVPVRVVTRTPGD